MTDDVLVAPALVRELWRLAQRQELQLPGRGAQRQHPLLPGRGAQRRVEGPVILVDGGSGSGKTTLGGALVEHAPVPATLVGLDSFYPGWDGLAAASRMVVDDVLSPTRPGYRRWDWVRDVPTDWVDLDPARALVVEGCGAITAGSRALADLAVWVELDADRRKERALARDGDGFAPHWDRWAVQESEHWIRDRPQELADVVVELPGTVRARPHHGLPG